MIANASERGEAAERAVAAAEAAAEGTPVSQDLVELRAELARAAIERGEFQAAQRFIERVPGGTLGAMRRAELWIELARVEAALVEAASGAVAAEADAAWPELALKLRFMAERIGR
ncbi:MAG: hypothetical protein EA423_07940 [Phycisphaerales bacterium]|nr:MAG: hypothetical protein EA423_07940 [Phycisphaerales bacterium]